MLRNIVLLKYLYKIEVRRRRGLIHAKCCGGSESWEGRGKDTTFTARI